MTMQRSGIGSTSQPSGLRCIDGERPTTIRALVILVLTLPAFLWIGGITWLFDREEYLRLIRWCFEDRTANKAATCGEPSADRRKVGGLVGNPSCDKRVCKKCGAETTKTFCHACGASVLYHVSYNSDGRHESDANAGLSHDRGGGND